MKGDKLLITDYHRKAARIVLDYLKNNAKLPTSSDQTLVITVAGESGCGKSETAAVLTELCEKEGFKTLILQQDDYFVYPPKTNHNTRLKDIGWVGTNEVKLDLIDQNIAQIKQKTHSKIKKPLVIFEEDKITEEEVEITNVQIVIAEGTYTTLLKNADIRVFIDRNYHQTKKARLARNRDPAVGFIEKVLEIEHKIISQHKQQADVIISPPEDER
ncbi:MAG: hypothetical protein ACFFCZ_04560 [Promethearchaeota archaeon]